MLKHKGFQEAQQNICGALSDLLPFVHVKKREKQG